MKTLKEVKRDITVEWSWAYYLGYKDCLEGIFNEIIDSQATNVESIEKYLQDLINK